MSPWYFLYTLAGAFGAWLAWWLGRRGFSWIVYNHLDQNGRAAIDGVRVAIKSGDPSSLQRALLWCMRGGMADHTIRIITGVSKEAVRQARQSYFHRS